MPALPYRHHGGDRLHRASRGLSAGPGHLTMDRARTSLRTLQNLPGRRWGSAAMILTSAALLASVQPPTQDPGQTPPRQSTPGLAACTAPRLRRPAPGAAGATGGIQRP